MKTGDKIFIALGILIAAAFACSIVSGVAIFALLKSQGQIPSAAKPLSNFTDTTRLSQTLAQAYPQDHPSVDSCCGGLDVTFKNSATLDLPDVDRQKKAEEIGRFVVHHYASIDSIQVIHVIFLGDDGEMLDRSYVYTFSTEELGYFRKLHQ